MRRRSQDPRGPRGSGNASIYAAVLEASDKASWRIEDVIGGDKRLDFGKPFLPESLARTEALPFLSPSQRLALNQIRAGGYLRMFGLVEEFILPFVVAHAQPQPAEDMERTHALLRFAAEEAKHIQLFRMFSEEFESGFGTPCGFIGPAEEIAAAVLAHEPLAVALVILHVEWMTQLHYVGSVRDRQELRPAVQEPPTPSLDGGGAARAARRAHGRFPRRLVRR